jgi:hypothetical protein
MTRDGGAVAWSVGMLQDGKTRPSRWWYVLAAFQAIPVRLDALKVRLQQLRKHKGSSLACHLLVLSNRGVSRWTWFRLENGT